MEESVETRAWPDWPDALAARRNFERAAASAATVDALAREVEQRMAERLQWVRVAPRRILDAGCGLGKGMDLLRARYPDAGLHGVDAAQPMLRQARERGPLAARWLARLRGAAPLWTCADFSRLPFAPQGMDLLWSNLALAWSPDLPAVFREFHRVMAAGGLLMFSTYGPDTLRELRAAFAGVDAYPHTQRFVDMHDIGDMLVAAGFATPVLDMEVITLTYADFAALAADLRASGQGNAAQGRRRGLMGAAAWRRAGQDYPLQGAAGARLPATFEIVYGHAWRGEPRQAKREPAVVRFEMRPRKS